MKTAADMLDRMEALVRKIADKGQPHYGFPATLVEARAIVAELLVPVDPLLIEAREAIAAMPGRPYYSWHIRDGSQDDTPLVQGAYQALRHARARGE